MLTGVERQVDHVAVVYAFPLRKQLEHVRHEFGAGHDAVETVVTVLEAHKCY